MKSEAEKQHAGGSRQAFPKWLDLKGYRHLLALAAGLITGAFAARLVLELTARPWPPFFVVTVGALLAGAGGAVAWRLSHPRRRGENSDTGQGFWVLLLLGVYLVWPRRQLSVAVCLLILVGLVALLEWKKRTAKPADPVTATPEKRRLVSPQRWADILTFSLALVLYVITTAPDVLPADSGEFQVVASLLGVAHPPGYPLYTMLGWLATQLIPFGNEAYRLNLMSALFAAGTLTLLAAAVRHWARHLGASASAALVGGLAAALTLGSATTFWAQATVANIRMPTMFAAALGLYALARYAETKEQSQADRALMLLALALGLGIGHHPSLVFLAIFFLLYLVLIDPRLLVQPRRWWKPALIFLIALLPLLYLPLRADAPLAPSDSALATWDGFKHHITAQGFEGDMFAYANAQDLPQRLVLLPTLFLFQFNPALLAASALGLILLAWRDWRLLALLAGGLVLHTFVTITYRAPQTVEYLMPAYLSIAILVGLTTAWLLSADLWRSLTSHRLRWRAHPAKDDQPDAPRPADPSALSRGTWSRRLSILTTLLAATILLAGLINGTDHGPSFLTLARDPSTREAMAPLLDQAPAGALVLADWHWATPLWYLQWVEGQRPDVDVRYVWPIPGQEHPDTWRQRIEENIGQRPLLLTHAYDWPEYTLEPLGAGFWTHQRPHNTPPLGLTALDATFGRSGDDGAVRLLGYALSPTQASPGQAVELTLAWQAVGEISSPPSFTVWLATNDGQRLTAADRYLVPGYTPGEIRFERLVLPLYPDTPPGEYDLNVQVYNSGEAGFETWPLWPSEGFNLDTENTLNVATLPVEPAATPALTLHPQNVPFKDGPTLVGVDYDRSMPDSLRLYLNWKGPAQGGEQINVRGSSAQLPALAEGAYHTTVLDLPPGTTGRLALTLINTDGQANSLAGPWGWSLHKVNLPAPSDSARFVPLSDEMALIGVSPGAGESFTAGDEWLLRLTFLGLKPLVSDNAISVRLLD